MYGKNPKALPAMIKESIAEKRERESVCEKRRLNIPITSAEIATIPGI